MTGRLIGVGVGPGDPELLTLKAARLIDEAQVIAYPAPDDGRSFARSIVADRLGGQREIPIVVPMRTERFPAREVYERASGEIASELDAGRDVVVLCEGDPFFYGSFMYLFERLADRYETEIVPGITSLTATAAALRQPLCARNEVLRIVPGPSDDGVVAAALTSGSPVVFIKVGRHLARLCKAIEEANLTARSSYIERATLPNERMSPLADLTGATAPYFSMILVAAGEGWRNPHAAT